MRHQAQLMAEEEEKSKKYREYKSQFNNVSIKNRPDPGRGQSYDARLKQRARDAEEAIYIDSIRKLSDIEIIRKPSALNH